MHMICMSRYVADGSEADVRVAWPLEPSLKLGASGTGLAGGLVEWLLEGVIDEDVLHRPLAEPGLDEAPLSSGVELAGMEPSVGAGCAAAGQKVADVDIAAGLMAPVLVEWATLRSAGVADLDPGRFVVVVVKDVKGMEKLIGGILGHVGARPLADNEAWVGRDDDSVHERAVIGASDGLGGRLFVIREDAQLGAGLKSGCEGIPALDGVEIDPVAGGDVGEGFATADAMHMQVALPDDELLALSDALQRCVVVEGAELSDAESMASGDAPRCIAGDNAVADFCELGGGGRGIECTGADDREGEGE